MRIALHSVCVAPTKGWWEHTWHSPGRQPHPLDSWLINGHRSCRVCVQDLELLVHAISVSPPRKKAPIWRASCVYACCMCNAVFLNSALMHSIVTCTCLHASARMRPGKLFLRRARPTSCLSPCAMQCHWASPSLPNDVFVAKHDSRPVYRHGCWLILLSYPEAEQDLNTLLPGAACSTCRASSVTVRRAATLRCVRARLGAAGLGGGRHANPQRLQLHRLTGRRLIMERRAMRHAGRLFPEAPLLLVPVPARRQFAHASHAFA